MNLHDAERLVKTCMEEHSRVYPELSGWTFRWNTRKTSLGLCNPYAKTIELSKVWTKAGDWDNVRDTILHEIAHVLAGCHNGHNHVWKAFCRKLGANPERCADVPDHVAKAVRGQAKWHIVYVPEDNEAPVEPVKGMHRLGVSMYGRRIIGRPETTGRLFYVETKWLNTPHVRKYMTKGNPNI